MISSLKESFALIATKPGILIPAVIIALANLIILNALAEQFFDVVFDLVYTEGFLLTSFAGFFFYLFQAYPVHLILFLIAGLVIGILTLLLSFVFARFAKEKKLGKSFAYAKKRFKDVIYLIIFFVCLVFLAWTGFYFILFLGSLLGDLLGFILLILYALLLLYLFLRLYFIIPAMALKDLNLKKGLQASWQFTGKRFLAVLALFIGIAVINFVLGSIEEAVNSGIEAVDLNLLLEEELGIGLIPLLASLFFTALTLAYSNLWYALYFLKAKK